MWAISIHDQLITFHGRCSFRMLIPTKPGKYGLKLCMMANSETSNYTDAQLYPAELAGRLMSDSDSKECWNCQRAVAALGGTSQPTTFYQLQTGNRADDTSSVTRRYHAQQSQRNSARDAAQLYSRAALKQVWILIRQRHIRLACAIVFISASTLALSATHRVMRLEASGGSSSA